MSEHYIKHRWREELILPVRCIVHNIDFVTKKEEKYIIGTDNVKGKVVFWKEIHLCELEEKIKKLYNLSVWDFMKRWFDNGEEFDSAHFIYIKSKKVE